jgi:hypothetical protein
VVQRDGSIIPRPGRRHIELVHVVEGKLVIVHGSPADFDGLPPEAQPRDTAVGERLARLVHRDDTNVVCQHAVAPVQEPGSHGRLARPAVAHERHGAPADLDRIGVQREQPR